MKRLSATAASRGFADVLDRVEHRGEEFVIERRGRDVAVMVPIRRPTGRASIVGDLIAAVQAAPPSDARFLKDLRAIRSGQGRPRDAWASSSTRRS